MCQLVSQFGMFAAAADEARFFSGQVARPAGGPGHERQITSPSEQRSQQEGQSGLSFLNVESSASRSGAVRLQA